MAAFSTEDRLELVSKYTAWIVAHGTGSVEAGDWPVILGDDLFARAVAGGFFGPAGTIPGLDYSVAVVEPPQVNGTTTDDGRIIYRLYAGGALIAEEYGDGNFDTVAFAKRHGYDI